MEQREHGSPVRKAEKIPVVGHIMCGWPFLLALIGGAIGGALGGVAYGVNLGIYRSTLAVPVKVILNILTGSAAAVLWMLIAMVIQTKFSS